jgi:AraC family transcriptional regulator, L-rhamnose operon transcriptional activator RhaR
MQAERTYLADNFFTDNVSFFINRFEELPRSQMIMHNHDFIELCYVCAGSGYHTVDGHDYQVQKGDFFIINYDVPHSFYKVDPQAHLTTYNVMFHPDFLDPALLDFHDFNNLTLSLLFRDVVNERYREDLRLDAAQQVEFEKILSVLYQEYQQKAPGYQTVLRATLQTLIIRVLRCLARMSVQDTAADKKARLVALIIEQLRVYDHQVLNLSDLARKMFYSKNYLCTVFRETTGCTLTEYLQAYRVEEAFKLLSSGKSLQEIAETVGFPDYKTFYRAFKKVKGKSPSTSRRFINELRDAR